MGSVNKVILVGNLGRDAELRYTPGGATLVATMKQHGAYCALVSGGFTYFTGMVKRALGFDFEAANVLKHDAFRKGVAAVAAGTLFALASVAIFGPSERP